MYNRNENEWGVAMGYIFLIFTIGILGTVAFAPRESFEAWAVFMSTVVRPAAGMVTGY